MLLLNAHWDGEPWLPQVSLWVLSQAGECFQVLTVRQSVREAGLEGDGSVFCFVVLFFQKRKIPCYMTEGTGGRKRKKPSWHAGAMHGVHAHENLCPLHLNIGWHQLSLNIMGMWITLLGLSEGPLTLNRCPNLWSLSCLLFLHSGPGSSDLPLPRVQSSLPRSRSCS